MRFTTLLTAAALLATLPLSALAQDAVDLHTVAIHDSPADIADWPTTVHIDRLTMATPAGLSFDTSGVPASWDYHVPGWGTGTGCPADGCVLYTVWAVVNVKGAIHAAGFIQMWAGRPATGAPILTDFHKNWAYACDRWAGLCEYLPQPGDLMGFFITAGNARDTTTVTSRRERSNVVVVRLPANDTGVFDFTAAPPVVTPPTPPVVVPPVVPPVVVVPPVLPSTDLTPVLSQQAIDHALLLELQRELTSARQDIAEFRAAVKSKWEAIMGSPIVRYGLAAVSGWLVTRMVK